MGRVWPKRKNGKESPERQYNKTDDQPKLHFRQPPEAAEWYGSQREPLVWTVRDLTEYTYTIKMTTTRTTLSATAGDRQLVSLTTRTTGILRTRLDNQRFVGIFHDDPFRWWMSTGIEH